MLILGFDTSCDDTSVAVVENGSRILSNIIASQTGVHSPYGGIVPEIAARKHTEAISWVILEAVKEAGITLEELNAVAATALHGLSGSLVVGVAAAKSLSLRFGIPLLGINHIEAHIYTPILGEPDLTYPHLCLTVSGGHTLLVDVHGPLAYEVIGKTLDDAAGEAFDKVARHLGLGFPGGPAIEKISKSGDPKAFNLPRPMSRKGGFDFSFSGLKTAVITVLEKNPDLEPPDLAASFQEAAIDSLWIRSKKALRHTGRKTLTVAGGVAVNRRFREVFTKRGEAACIRVVFAPPRLCGDNGAMVAAVAYHRFIRGESSGLNLDIKANVLLKKGKSQG